MSNNNNERRELTAAELDMVAGAIYMEYDGVKLGWYTTTTAFTQSPATSFAGDGLGAAHLNDVEGIDFNAVIGR
jgi:hypothetical protein